MRIISNSRYDAMIGAEHIIASRDLTILSLRDDIRELKDRLQLALERQDREQQRADNALSLACRVKTGQDPESPPVTPSLPEIDPHAEDPAEVEAIRQEMSQYGPIQTLLSRK